MNTMNSLMLSLALALTVGVMAGCEEDDSSASAPKGTTSLTMQATNAAHSTGVAAMWRNIKRTIGFSEAYAVASGTDGFGNILDVTDFQIALEQIEFKSEGEDEATAAADTEVEFEGPFAVDLLDTTGALAQTLGDVAIPAGIYDGIIMKMHKADELDPTLYPELVGRSVYIAGTYDPPPAGGGTFAFTMWHETGEEFNLAGANGFEVTEGTTGNDLIVDFKLQSIFAGIDLSTCASGIIEPNSVDTACKAIADLLKDNIKAAADFGKDEDGDGDVGEDEDVD